MRIRHEKLCGNVELMVDKDSEIAADEENSARFGSLSPGFSGVR